MERKIFQSAFQLKSAGEGAFRATLASLNCVDHDGDVSVPGSFPVGKRIVISAYQHSSWQNALPVGQGIIGANSTKAWCDGQFFVNTVSGRDHYLTVKGLAEQGLGEWSFGFEVLESSTDYSELKAWPGAVRILKRLNVFEASPVLVGAGIGTRTEWVKSARSSGQSVSDAEFLRSIKDHLETIDDRLETVEVWGDCMGTMEKTKDAGTIAYGEVDPECVREKDHNLASLVLAQACAHLGIKTPSVQWFNAEGEATNAYRKQYGADWYSFRADPHLGGRSYKGSNAIWLNADLEGADLVEVTAHEAFHLTQADGASEQGEREAYAYGQAARARYINDN